MVQIKACKDQTEGGLEEISTLDIMHSDSCIKCSVPSLRPVTPIVSLAFMRSAIES